MNSQDHEQPNTGGRPLGSKSIRTRAGRHAQDAIEALAAVANDGTAPTGDRVRAAELLLAHAHGTAGGGNG